MIINLLGGSSPQRFIAAGSQRSINWYPVVGEQTKTQISLSPTPGLTLYTTLPGRYPRGFFTVRTHLYTKCFAVIDNILYEVQTNGTYSTIGTMTNMAIGASRVRMECNLQNELFIGEFTASYVYDIDTGALTQVTDIDFPDSVTHATYLDQYGIVVSGGAVFESETTSFLNWNSVQSYSPTFRSAPVVAVGASREQIFNFTSETIEVFYNDGDSPYSRLPRSTISMGIKSADSLASFANGFVFIGKAREGEANVYFYDGWNPPTPLGDAGIAWAINQSSSLEDCYGYVQETKEGKNWYYLTIPDLGTTFVYDFKTQLWHERRSKQPFSGSDGTDHYGIFRGAFYTSFNNQNFFLDYYSGKVFVEDYTVNTEDSLTLKRERTSQVVSQEDKLISYYEMIIDCSTGLTSAGVSPVLEVSWSNDGGHTFSSPKQITLGEQGAYSTRVRLSKLGSSRRRVFKFSLTDDADIMVQAAYVNALLGSY